MLRFHAFPQSTRFYLALLTIAICCLAMIPMLSQSGSDGTDTDDPPAPPKLKAEGGQFYARVVLRDDILAVNEFFAEIKIHPTDKRWPGAEIKPREAYSEEVNLKTNIRIRGISVPTILPNPNQPHQYVERERDRFDDAVHFVWGLISDNKTPNARPLILANPTVAKDGLIEVDMWVMVGGHTLNVAVMLVKDGHARYGNQTDWDWGHRAIQKR